MMMYCVIVHVKRERGAPTSDSTALVEVAVVGWRGGDDMFDSSSKKEMVTVPFP